MRVYHSLEDFPDLKFAVVTGGMYDGVHKAHRIILSRLQEIAALHNGETVVLTFWPHPRMVVSDDSQDLELLSTIDEKIELLEKIGIDHLLILPFTRAFSELSGEEYIQKILVESIGVRKLVIGYDHRFGRNREGNFEFLQCHCDRFGFDVEEIPRQEIDALAVSSSRIRSALKAGQVHEANELLGRAYSLTGTVVKGKQLGRTIGFPTANIQLSAAYKLVPANGVYVIRATYQELHLSGILNIGVRPTVDGTSRTIEAHLFDFDKEIYGELLSVEFVEYIRPEQKFEGLQQLVAQINRDKQTAEAFFKR